MEHWEFLDEQGNKLSECDLPNDEAARIVQCDIMLEYLRPVWAVCANPSPATLDRYIEIPIGTICIDPDATE